MLNAKRSDRFEVWRKSDLRHAKLMAADLTDVDFSNANMTDADLTSANLSGAQLAETLLVFAHLSGAILCDADLTHATLGGADFTDSNLSRAKLCGANLGNVRLRGSTRTGEELYAAATFHRTILEEADFFGAKLNATVFTECDLSRAKRLEHVVHRGPGDIGMQTLIASGGNIHEVFLRGCGLPEEWIRYLPSLIGSLNPIDYYSCFISYSHADKSFARRLHDALQGRGIRCWLDEHQMLPGDDMYEHVDRGMRLWDKVLLCASESSLTSWWVDREIDTAIEKEMQLRKERGKQTLAIVPLNLCTGPMQPTTVMQDELAKRPWMA